MAAQRDFLRSRCPAYARLLDVVEAELESGLEARLMDAWRGREFGAFYERPLLLLAALRSDALREGPRHPLWRAIASPQPDPDAIDRAALRDALAPGQTTLWSALASRHLQTNEPTRAVAWLWPARLAADATGARPLDIADVGASAGLNLIADHLSPTWQRADGTALDVGTAGSVRRRVGFDPRPLDVTDDEDAHWLRACVWPGQGDREARLQQAIDVFRQLKAQANPPVVERARAAEVPALLPLDAGGTFAIAYQTIMRDYLSASEWETYRTGMLGWLGSRPPCSAMWVELEVAATVRSGGPPVELTTHMRSARGLETFALAACDPHPQRLTIDERAVAELVAALRS
jgi:hypothetical protein